MNIKYERLLKIIGSSINAVGAKYFDFQVAGSDEPVKRERVYCSELYHQMRMKWEHLEYDLNIEPDKKNHPIIEEYCGPIDPDLVIHRGGNMGPEDNLAVIEVKTSRGDLTAGIEKDLESMNCMTSIPNGYFGGVLIVFGELTELRKRNLIERVRKHKSEKMRRLTLFLQERPETLPEMIEIE
jgi:hypothetical protein